MSRVVVNRTDSALQEAAESCPVSCFRKNNGEYVIDGSQCIDCGVCQTLVAEGSILEDSEANEADTNFNNEKAGEWESAI